MDDRREIKQMTKKQIEELELIARGYVDLYYKDADKLMKNLKNIEEFLKAGGEIFFIDWREVEKMAQSQILCDG